MSKFSSIKTKAAKKEPSSVSDTSILKKVKCALCPYSARKKCLLKAHVDTVHYGLRPFSCELCSYSAGSKVSFI